MTGDTIILISAHYYYFFRILFHVQFPRRRNGNSFAFRGTQELRKKYAGH